MKEFKDIVWKFSHVPVWLFIMIHSECKTEDGRKAFYDSDAGTDYWGKNRRYFMCEKHELEKGRRV
jgi:hypothetical protein